MTIKLPWKVRLMVRHLRNISAYVLNKTYYFFLKRRGECPVVCFYCHFHGTTGATIAIAQIANLLAKKYHVEFVTKPRSDFNGILNFSVELINKLSPTNDLIVCDGSTPLNEIKSLCNKGRRVLITSHGILPKGLRLEKIEAASATHFVSELQLMHHVLGKDRYFVIPNCCDQLIKTSRTQNVGIVGRVADPKKNVETAISSALLSRADQIQVWGGEGGADMGSRVVFHSWQPNKEKIYNSFDVLLSLSLEESFGLTVIEAMSAGIPCVLSDIPAFRAFSECPGVVLVDCRDKGMIACKLDELLLKKESLSSEMIEFWRNHYSCSVISALWCKNVDRLISG